MADEERSRREVRILPAVIAAGVAVAIAVGVVAYAAGHYGEQTKTLTIQAAGGPGTATSREGVAAGGCRRAHLRPVRAASSATASRAAAGSIRRCRR